MRSRALAERRLHGGEVCAHDCRARMIRAQGGLLVRSVPVGSRWEIVVSDIPVVRRTYTEAA
jgi:hypothetical protein